MPDNSIPDTYIPPMWRAPESRRKSSHNISRRPVDPEYREKLKNFIEKKEERERDNWSRLSRSLERKQENYTKVERNGTFPL